MSKPSGFVLAVGVLIDAFRIWVTLRLTLMYLLEEKTWYPPACLNFHLLDLNIEGTKLVAAPTAPELPLGSRPSAAVSRLAAGTALVRSVRTHRYVVATLK